MRFLLSIVLAAAFLPSCSHEPPTPEVGRPVITPDSVTVTVGATQRSFFLSDKRGGFLVGTADTSLEPQQWSARGQTILSGFTLTVDGVSLLDTNAERIVIAPHLVEAHYGRDITLRLSLLGIRYADSWLHGLVIKVRSSTGRSIRFRPELLVGAWRTHREQSGLTWEAGGKRYLSVSGGSAGRSSGDVFLLDGVSEATLLLVYGNRNVSAGLSMLHERLDDELVQRDERLARLLNDNYVHTGSTRLNRALWWSRATLDGLVVEGDDTSAVPGLPWDGSFNGRTVAHSLSGISVANGDRAITRTLIRWLARQQDTVLANTTYGRLPTRFGAHGRDYTGADVAPDFVRQMYEVVSKTNDTSLVRELYPMVRRSIEGTIRYHADTLGFLTHGRGETWMESRGSARGSLSRGNRAVELQTSWYYQQLIGSFMAAQMRDTSAYRAWSRLAAKTLSNFNRMFIDSSTNLVYDHITSAGRSVRERRPNALFSIDLLNAEKIQQNIIINTMKSNVYQHGVATLGYQDRRFTPYVPSAGTGGEFYNGPVWTWLSGQVVYSLSRYDRQDLAFRITGTMIDHLLDRGMVGGLPAVMDARPREGANEIQGGAVLCSLDGIAEFIRNFYQDYAGITIDASANELSLHPKLPAGLLPLDCTVFVGPHPVRVTYRTIEGTLRVALSAPGLRFPLKVAFLLMIENGDAWQGLTLLEPGRNLVLALNAEQVTAFRGTEEVSPGSVRHLKGFSQRNVFTDLHFADERETMANGPINSRTGD